jgi:hypothetical protein
MPDFGLGEAIAAALVGTAAADAGAVAGTVGLIGAGGALGGGTLGIGAGSVLGGLAGGVATAAASKLMAPKVPSAPGAVQPGDWAVQQAAAEVAARKKSARGYSSTILGSMAPSGSPLRQTFGV